MSSANQTLRAFRTLPVALALVLATGSAERAQAFDVPTFVKAWGGLGSADGLFNFPGGAAISQSGEIYVADSGQERIQKFDSSGAFLLKWGSFGSADGQFDNPLDVAVDPSGYVYVMDTGNRRVEKFTATGSFVRQIGSPGGFNGPPGTFYLGPRSVASDGAGNVYVVDTGNTRIQKFDSNGNFIRLWGSGGLGDGQFQVAFAIAVGPDGTVYVTDVSSDNVQAFDSTGVFLRKWGSSGSGPGQLSYARGITVDASGTVYVADADNNRIEVFSSTGTYEGQWGGQGTGDGQFSEPTDVAVLGTSIFVMDSSGRIQEFSTAPVPAAPTSWGRVKDRYH